MNPDKIRLGILKGELEFVSSEEQIAKAKEGLAKCYEDIIEFLGEWVDISEDSKKIISLWIIGTYFHKSFSTYPYLFFNAMRGSGKTRLLSIISWLQYNGNGNVLNNPSEPVLFRTAKDRGLIFDEFESEKSKDKQTMREYLNSCYKKGGVVYRMEKQKIEGKETMVAVGHNLFTPVAMANINGIESVLQDRSITLILEKSMNFAFVKKIEDFEDNEKIKDLKVRLTQFSVGLRNVWYTKNGQVGWNAYITDRYTTPLHHTPLLHYYTQLHTDNTLLDIFRKIDESNIFGRNLELFLPLLLIAESLSTFLFDEILKIVINLNQTKKTDEFIESIDVTLYEFVSTCEKYRFESVFVNELLNEFKEYLGKTSEEQDREMNSSWFGLALKRLDLIGLRKRVAKGSKILLNVDKAKEKIKIFKVNDELPDTPKTQ